MPAALLLRFAALAADSLCLLSLFTPPHLVPTLDAADRTALQRTLHATGEELAASHTVIARLEAAAEGLQDQLWRGEEALRRCELQCQGLRQQNAALEEARAQVGPALRVGVALERCGMKACLAGHKVWTSPLHTSRHACNPARSKPICRPRQPPQQNVLSWFASCTHRRACGSGPTLACTRQ